jgi:hypothetical protein
MPNADPRPALRAAAIAWLLAALPAAALVLAGHNAGRAAWDSVVYHESVIRRFIAEWPGIDVTNTLTATTPGYHVVLAAIGVAVSPSTIVLRLASVAIGATFVAVVAAWCARRVGARDGILLALPLVASVYVLGSSAWLLPDNLGWLLVTGILATCLRPRWRAVDALAVGAMLGVLVAVRQSHAWAAAPLVCAAWCGGERPADRCAWRHPPSGAPGRVAVALAAAVPAFLLLAAFAALWGGLVPPRFQSDVARGNAAVPAYVLFQFALLGAAFLPWLWVPVADAWRARRRWMLAAGVAGLLLAAVPATVPDVASGRYSGWWSPLSRLPAIAGHANPVLLVAAPAGAMLLAGALLALTARARAVLGVAMVAFTASQSANFYAWQRYHEPFVLVVLAMLSALAASRVPPMRAGVRYAAIGGLCALLAAVSWVSLDVPPVAPDEKPMPQHLTPEERAAMGVHLPGGAGDHPPPAALPAK